MRSPIHPGHHLTIKDSYPLLLIDETLDMLQSGLRSGFWQIPVDPASRPLTAFTSYEGLYEFNKLPFGLCNAPSTFQRLMELVLRGLQWDICLIYLDDIIVFSATFDDHIARLRNIFARLRHAELKLKPSKCIFLHRKVDFLGHIISPEGVLPNPDKVSLVRKFPNPTTPKQIKQFLGLCGYYRRFLKTSLR